MKRFGGFTKFKILAGIPTMSVLVSVKPEEATNHLLECINELQFLPGYNRYRDWCKASGMFIGVTHFKKYWGAFHIQVSRCGLYLKDDISYDDLIKPLIRDVEKRRVRRSRSLEDESCDYVKKASKKAVIT